jgi:hypothetical protein
VKVFISWSGDRSKALAETLRDWLPTVVQSLQPFMSALDIPSGGRGLSVLGSELGETSVGILCLTHENKDVPWINFEAGALAKAMDTGRVIPFLLDLKASDLTGPLAQFQAVISSEQAAVFAMVKSLAEWSSPPVIPEDRLRRVFDSLWPDLKSRVGDLGSMPGSDRRKDGRAERDIIEEVLVISRRTEQELTRLANMRVAERVLSERRHSGKEPSPWWVRVSRAAVDDLLLSLKPLGVTIRSYTTDESGLHIIIDAQESDIAQLREEFRTAADAYMLPIHVRGEPFGDEMFEALSSPR